MIDRSRDGFADACGRAKLPGSMSLQDCLSIGETQIGFIVGERKLMGKGLVTRREGRETEIESSAL
jgi:hypothetical protein